MSEYRKMFDEIHASDALRQEVRNMTHMEQRTGQKRRKLPKTALIAAILVIALAGTALAAVGVPTSLQGWFSRMWEESSSAPMPETQAALIDSLTQPVDVSDTQNGITVTLDSITVGDSAIWLLLKAEGDFAPRMAEPCHFGPKDLIFAQDPDENDSPGGCSIGYPFVGVAEDGKLTMLMHYTVTLTGEDSLFDGGEAELVLENLLCGDKTLAEGEWRLPFAIEPVENQQLLTIDSAVVPARDHENGGAETTVEIRNIRVSATGIRFHVAAEDAECYPQLAGIVLTDMEVPGGDGGSRWVGEPGEGRWTSDMNWNLPVELSKAQALRFGDTLIPLR